MSQAPEESKTEVAGDGQKGKSSNKYTGHVVGIGASAGGLEALVQFFSQMPADSGLSFVVVQHLSPDFKSVMDELLARHTEMPIHLVEDGTELEPNSVYLIPPKKELVLRDRCLLLRDKDLTKSLSLPIDVFFKSMAADVGKKGIAIVLSGTGSDGSRGIVDVHDAGGIVIAQDCDSAKFDGMPRSASDTGLVDYVLTPHRIPDVLLRHIGSPLAEQSGEDMLDSGKRGQMDQYMELFQRLRAEFKTDFSYYKPTTVNRRIERRMAHHKVDTLEEYLGVMDQMPQEARALYQDLLIGVTKFFRDPEAFALLENEVIPGILDGKNSGDQVRVWVPGCATGEEAYSIAILFQEALSRVKRLVDVKIFATDLDGESISHAANGVYSAENLEHLTEERLNKFFAAHGDMYQVESDLRRMIVFAEQNILKDPPFTKMDLVSCRNLLIYFQPIAQRKAVSMFLFSLNVGGVLLLGPSETLGDLDGEFETMSRTWNVYKKRNDSRPAPLVNLPEHTSLVGNRGMERARHGSSLVSYSQRRAEDVELMQIYDGLLSEYMPPSLLVGPRNELVQVFGNAFEYIRTPRGRASLDVLSMVDGNLRLAVSTALKRVEKERKSFTLNNIPLDDTAEKKQFLDITVKPLRDERFALIQFILHPMGRESGSVSGREGSDFNADAESMSRIIDLEKELQFSRENLQATIEELETTNEELQATNEEMLASNEELQSTNEELQSVNEELFTVNTEYEKKNHELIQLNSDIDNLLQSTEIGTIFIDGGMKIRKFTPAVASIFNLLPMDVGRPFEHITYSLVEVDDIAELARSVIRDRQPVVREVQDRNGKWYLMRIFPYMTGRNVSAGAVLTLVDITSIKHTERELKFRSKALTNAKQDLEQFAYSVSHDMQSPLRVVSGYLDLLRRRSENADEEALEYLDLAYKGSLKLKDMINGLLTYTRIETRASEFEECTLDSILDEVEEAKRERLKECGASVLRESTQLVVYGEHRFLVYMLSELIENSLRFRGGAAPRIIVQADAQDGEVRVRIRDNGRGIEPMNQALVFNIFFQEESAENGQGIGVGLAVCKRIVMKHGGAIELDSSRGMGTTITFTLPNRVPDLLELQNV